MIKALTNTGSIKSTLVGTAVVVTALTLSIMPSHAQEKEQIRSQEDQKMVASVAAGGRLYDNWIRELAVKPPKKPHPLYPDEGRLADQPLETWRCVTCHGWDYLGDKGNFAKGDNFTGIKGIAGMIGTAPNKIKAKLKEPQHAYLDVFDDQAMEDIANFVSIGLVPMDRVIDRTTGRAMAKAQPSSPYYSTICVNCHGGDGRMMETIPPLGDAARNDPWQALHKMLNGHPGDDMPALRAFDVNTTLTTLAYVQALPSRDTLYSIARGGKLYDDWAAEIDTNYPKDKHKAFPKGKEIEANSSTWRCIECHGWDYKGAHGVRGIRNMIGSHPATIIKVLKDDVHNLDHKLNYADFYDLAVFVSRGQVDMNEYIDARTREARGNPDRSTQYYLTLCATCHGEEGRAIRTMPAIGRVATDKPWQALHKILHGHPGDEMPAWQATMTPANIKDVLAKLQTLPKRK
ncbi:MAG: cytochrome c [Magnetovibrio sp.]|nr:cytochrome c [Magnetovibrio sp.]